VVAPSSSAPGTPACATSALQVKLGSSTKATALKIYPPNQTEPVYLPNTSTGCSKPVQILFIGAVRPAS
jgi:hypothetical protein